MLSLSNNGETCKDQLCQHPQCWQTNVRRVREAVRQRNVIKEETVGVYRPRRLHSRPNKKLSFDRTETLSLPTLKVVDVTEDLIDTQNDGGIASGVQLLDKCNSEGYSTARSSPDRAKCHSSFGTQVPHTTPVSPSISEGKKRTRLKEKPRYEGDKNEKAKKISFHEICDYKEMCQDWQDTFISSAYLVWCPSRKNKRKRKKPRTSSAVTHYKTRGFKNIIEDALPLPVQDTNKKEQTSKVPTGGKPYSPYRSPATRQEILRRAVDYNYDGDFTVTVTKKNVPDSLITSRKVIADKPKATLKGQHHLDTRNTSGTKVHVDITSKLPWQVGHKNKESAKDIIEEDEVNAMRTDERTKHHEASPPKSVEPSQNPVTQFQPKKVLPLPSVSIPWGLLPMKGRGHCKNSIPHDVDLGVIMEPVIYLPRSASLHGDARMTLSDASAARHAKFMGAKVSGSVDHVKRNHLTSAYRFSPRLVLAPAPTPITPGTREGVRRQFSDLLQSNTTRSVSKMMLGEKSSNGLHQEHGDMVTKRSSSFIPVMQRSKTLDDHVILEVEETNRRACERVGIEVSTVCAQETVKESDDSKNEGNCTYLEKDLEKVNENESTTSTRAVSPSSRTNIPPDIWSELKGEFLDNRRITLRGKLDSYPANSMSKPMYRGFHSSLGLSVYYTNSSWKPFSRRLPQSFCNLHTFPGPYKQTILPKMPASLTVVSVPSLTRTSRSATQLRQYQLNKSSSIRMPPVPVVSPVPGIEVTIPGCNTGQTGSLIKDRLEFQREVISEGIGADHKLEDKEASGEVEYLVARHVISHQELGGIIQGVEENTSENGCLQESLPGEVVEDIRLSKLKESVPQIDLASEQRCVVLSSNLLRTGGERSCETFRKSADYVEEESDQLDKSEHVGRLVGDVRDKPITNSIKDYETGINLELGLSTSLGERSGRSCRSKVIKRSPSEKVQDLLMNQGGNAVDRAALKDDQDSRFNAIVPKSVEEAQPKISKQSPISKTSSDFDLEPFNVELELLRPICIESDLFLLNSDSLLGLPIDVDPNHLDKNHTDNEDVSVEKD